MAKRVLAVGASTPTGALLSAAPAGEVVEAYVPNYPFAPVEYARADVLDLAFQDADAELMNRVHASRSARRAR